MNAQLVSAAGREPQTLLRGNFTRTKGVLVFIVMFLVCLPCRAQQTPTSMEGKTKLKAELNKAGIEQLQNKHFYDASMFFEKAYELDVKDMVVKNNLINAYNAYAIEKRREKNNLEALFYLTKAFNLTHDNPEVLKNLSGVYFEIGREKCGEEQFNDAIAAFKKCVEIDSLRASALLNYIKAGYVDTKDATLVDHIQPIGFELYTKGEDLYAQHSYDKALKYIEESLKYDKNNFNAYRMQGMLYYLHQDFDKATAAWKEAFRVGTDDEKVKNELKEALKKLVKERAVEETLKPYYSDKFIIWFNHKESTEGSATILKVLRSAYTDVGREFNYYPQGKIMVIITRPDEENSKSESTGDDAPVTAMFDGKIRLPAISDTVNLKRFNALVWHEFTHALVYDMVGTNCPRWLNEGLAQYEENKIEPIQMTVFKEALKKGTTIPFLFFIRTKEDKDIIPSLYLFYQQSFSVTNYLVKRYNFYTIKKTLLETKKKRKDWNTIFCETIGVSPEQFEQKWLRYAKEQYL
jgi:tetratricopeptide (TPR) repeat protein